MRATVLSHSAHVQALAHAVEALTGYGVTAPIDRSRKGFSIGVSA